MEQGYYRKRDKIIDFLIDYLPILLSIGLFILVLTNTVHTPIILAEMNYGEIFNTFLVILTSVVAILITHKSIILIARGMSGFQKLLRAERKKNKFFAYLDRTIYASLSLVTFILLIKFIGISNIIQKINVILIEGFIVFLSSLVLLHFLRFILIFSIVFNDSFSKNQED